MKRYQLATRLPYFTKEQIELIQETYGMTKTQVLILAIDRLTQDLNPESGDADAICAAIHEGEDN